ncbi:MAG: zinc finger domain-containing protein [Ktedonobacteraceae bacterium]
MTLAIFANERLAIVKRQPRMYAIHVNESLLTRFAHGWYLDDQKVTIQQAISLAASGKIVLRKGPVMNPKQPITVQCPICQAPAGTPCTREGMNVAPWVGEMHVDRVHEARIADELEAGKAVA